jgi:polysaccharide export outer membrane protein
MTVCLIGVATSLCGCLDILQPGLRDAPLKIDSKAAISNDYIIGPGDHLQIFVWRNAELSTAIVVRPDGKISTPLIEDLPVVGLTPTQAARAVEERLSAFVKDAIVTVVMLDFLGPTDRQIRVVGEAAKPQAIPYRAGLTALDVMIQCGGLTQFAAGDRATILRVVQGQPTTYRLRLADLLKRGDMSVNAEMAPGDVLLIPQSWF